MAASRSRRNNAGNKIAHLLNEEEEDDFYKTSYGGFQEDEEDKEYEWALIIWINLNAQAI